MDSGQLITAILGLVFVLGLALVTITLLKWLQVKGGNFCALQKGNAKQINVVATRRIDAKHSVVIVEVDEVRYVMVMGGESPLLLNQQPIKGQKK